MLSFSINAGKVHVWIHTDRREHKHTHLEIVYWIEFV